MKKFMIFYNIGKGNVIQVRRANTKEEAMNKLCAQYGWGEPAWCFGPDDWSDGVFTKVCGKQTLGFEFRIMEK